MEESIFARRLYQQAYRQKERLYTNPTVESKISMKINELATKIITT
jgi:hypothetical protein